MKDSLFEILLNLFEQTLTKLKETQLKGPQEHERLKDIAVEDMVSNQPEDGLESHVYKPASRQSIRIFTYDEQMKLTKASYQFLMRLQVWGIVSEEALENILNQLFFSDLRLITLDEVKVAVRAELADQLDTHQLAFLDMVLFAKEQSFILH